MTDLVSLLIGVIDRSLQVRQLDEETVANYAEALAEGVELPPVDVAFDRAASTYYLIDGNHRVVAYERNEELEILAAVVEMSKQDARWAALGANARHGRPMSSEDKRLAIAIARREFPNRSANAIADQIGCSVNTVLKYMDSSCSNCTTESVEPTAQGAESDRVLGKDGKSYQKRKAKQVQRNGETERSTPPVEPSDSDIPDHSDESKELTVPRSLIESAQAGSLSADKAITTYTECYELTQQGQYDGRKLRKDIAKLQSAVDSLSHVETVVAKMLEARHAFHNIGIAIGTLSKHPGISTESLNKNKDAKQELFKASNQRLLAMRKFVTVFPQIADALRTVCSTEEEQAMVDAVRMKFAEYKERVDVAVESRSKATIKILNIVDANPPAAWFETVIE